jgi:CheY-like chemotaxis protein/membrane-associated phospholipid phosphatase
MAYVLIVEDDAISAELAAVVCRSLGHVAVVARDGRTALERIAGGGFDLVLMDVVLPELDGIEVTRQVRVKAAHADLPIIGVTALAGRGDVAEMLAAGMNAVITKPFRSGDLAQAIGKALAVAPAGPAGPFEAQAPLEGRSSSGWGWAAVVGLVNLAWVCSLIVLSPPATMFGGVDQLVLAHFRNGFVDELARGFDVIASPLAIMALTALIALRLAQLRQFRDAATLLFCMVGAELLCLAAKAGLTPLWSHMHPLAGPASPAGLVSTHTLLTMCLFGFTALWRANMDLEERDDWRKGIPVACLALIVMVGLSRIHLGVHSFSEVLWSWVLGFFWLCFASRSGRDLPACR